MSYDLAMDEHSATESGEQFAPYASPRFRGRVVLAALGVGALLTIASIVLSLRYLDYIFLLQAGDATEEDWAAQVRLDGIWQWVAWGEIGAYIATVVAWCFWKHRCHRNLPALGAIHLQFTPRSAVGFYFLPIFNLFRPYQAMREIRGASNPKAAEAIDCRPHKVSGGMLVVVWWLTYLAACMVTRIANSAGRGADESEDLSVHNAFAIGSIVAGAVFLIATLVAAWLVLDIVGRQERRAGMWRNG